MSAESNNSANSKCKLDDLLKNGFKTFVEATKASNDIPKGADYDYYNTHQSFTNALSKESSRLLTLVNRVLKANDIEGNVRSSTISAKDDIIGDANDNILDRAVGIIDELNGMRSTPANPVIQVVSAEVSINGAWNKIGKMTVNADALNSQAQGGGNIQKSISLLTAKNIVRPQSYFPDKIDNSNLSPWKPRIIDKPNSLKPLALYLEPSSEHEDLEEYSHPYEFELEHFKVPEEFVANVAKPMDLKTIHETPFHEITTAEQLNGLVEELGKYKEIAIDLEHHSYRTFQGITCLMQISTRDADYIVDTLTLRNQLECLNQVFTRPSIVKIFHGADSDVLWLQRDLSLYIVNMFDTHKAATALGYSSLSLAYLLKRFCACMPNKQFQLADWRIRPLPQELKDYAREDTHYLIHIYERLKQELYKMAHGKDNLIHSVFQSSNEVCKKKYVKPRWTPDSHMHLYRRRRKMFDNRQMHALKGLYKWRDAIARQEDESVGYVLPNHMMMQIAEMLPKEVQGILASCNPIPPLVRANSLELHHIILEAREQPLERTISENNRKIFTKESVKINIDSPLYCPHDSTKHDFKDNLPTLLQNMRSVDCNGNKLLLEKPTSSCKVFNDIRSRNSNKSENVRKIEFLGPYERYKLIKPFLQAEAEREAKEAKEREELAKLDPPVSDRIAALHEHFIQVKEQIENKDAAADVSLSFDQPLISFAGATKRKRAQSKERITPVLEDAIMLNNSPESESYNPTKKQKLEQVHTSNSVANNGKPNKNKKSKKKVKQNQQADTNANNSLEENETKAQRRKKARKARNAQKKAVKDENKASEDKKGVVDYANVDYSEYSGGGKTVQPKQFESKHKTKRQSSRLRGRGNSQNRSMNFSTRGEGKPRGRGGR